MSIYFKTEVFVWGQNGTFGYTWINKKKTPKKQSSTIKTPLKTGGNLIFPPISLSVCPTL